MMNLFLRPYLKFAADLSKAVYHSPTEEPLHDRINRICLDFNDANGTHFTFNRQSDPNTNDYEGIAVEDPVNRITIISHRGSFTTHDIRSNAAPLVRGEIPAAWETVKTFCSQTMNGKEGYTFIHVGHSLGGAYSEMCVNQYQNAGNHFAISFESTGTKTTIEKINEISGVQTNNDYLNKNVVGLVGAPNIFNTLQPFIGHRYRVYIPHSRARAMGEDMNLILALLAGVAGIPSLLLEGICKTFWFTYWFNQHKLTHLIEAFGPDAHFPRLIREVIHWPLRANLLRWAAAHTFGLRGKNLIDWSEHPHFQNLYMEAILPRLNPNNAQNTFLLDDFELPDPTQITAGYINRQLLDISMFYGSDINILSILTKSYLDADIYQPNLLNLLQDRYVTNVNEVTLGTQTGLQIENKYTQNVRVTVSTTIGATLGGAAGAAGAAFAAGPALAPAVLLALAGGAVGGVVGMHLQQEHQAAVDRIIAKGETADRQLRERLIQITHHFSERERHLNNVNDEVNNFAENVRRSPFGTIQEVFNQLQQNTASLERDHFNHRHVARLTLLDEVIYAFFRLQESSLQQNPHDIHRLQMRLRKIVAYLRNPDRHVDAHIFSQGAPVPILIDYDPTHPNGLHPSREGQFSTVDLGSYRQNSETVNVAIQRFRNNHTKTLNDREILNLRHQTNHDNVLKFLGYMGRPALITGFIMERAAGNLRLYLNNNPVLLAEKLRFIQQIAAALINIQHSIYGYHGNLNASNVLLDGQLNCKVSLLATNSNEEIELWQAPEAITNMIATRAVARSQELDIYRLSITIYEIITQMNPYQNQREHDLLNEVIFNGWPRVNEGMAPLPLITLMENCWAHNPTHRPRIKTIATELDQIAAQLPPPPPMQAAAQAPA